MSRSRHGSLDLQQINPADIQTVADSEFGFICQIQPSRNQPVYLYAGIPNKKLVEELSKETPLPIGQSAYPAVLMQRNGKEGIFVQAELRAGEQVLASEVPGRDDILAVATFRTDRNVVPGMPESGLGIEIISKGYIRKDDAQKMQSTELFRRDKSDLFPNNDLVADVKQGIFGDCFLLSSILAILKSKPEGSGEEFIRGMMRQEGKYTVVRLFDPNTKEPVYVRVENSVHYENGRRTVNHAALWVHILEKAYTYQARKKRQGSSTSILPYEYAHASFRDMFGKGGDAELALTILTGQPSDSRPVPVAQCTPGSACEAESLMYSIMVNKRIEAIVQAVGKDVSVIDRFLETIPVEDTKVAATYLRSLYNLLCYEDDPVKIMQSLPEQLSKGHPDNKQCEELLRVVRAALVNKSKEEQLEILNSLGMYFDEYIKLRVESTLPVSTLFKNISDIGKLGAYIESVSANPETWQKFTTFAKSVKTLDEATRFVNQVAPFNPPMPAYLLEIFRKDLEVALVQGKLRWNGLSGTGQYNQASLDFFHTIKAHIDNNRSVVASTLNSFPEPVPGLRSQHAYAVVGTYEDKEDGCLYITIRNPWGHTGRKYDNSHGASEDHKLATFNVELSDFVRYFEKYSVGSLPTPEQLLALGRRQRSNNDVPLARKEGFFRRHWKVITGAAMGGAIAGLSAGAGIGAVAAFVGAIPSFGLSVLAIPVFAAVGCLVGAVSGAVTGIVSCVIADRIEAKRKRRLGDREYVAVNNNSPIPSPDSSPEASPKVIHRRETDPDKGKGRLNPVLPEQMPSVVGSRDTHFHQAPASTEAKDKPVDPQDKPALGLRGSH